MTAWLKFNIPWDALCSDNRKYVKGHILSKQYRESKAYIGALSLKAAKRERWAMTTLPLGVQVTVYQPDYRRRDLNWSKNFKDGISQGGRVWHDDSQVRVEMWAFATGHPDRAKAGADVLIWTLDADEYPTKKPKLPPKRPRKNTA